VGRLVLDGVKTETIFDDLCSPCARAVKALLMQVGKKIEGLSPDRKQSAKPKAEAKKVDKPADKKPSVNGHPVHAKG
jgi:hypothetical protein